MYDFRASQRSRSSIGQSVGLRSRRLQVRAPPGTLSNRQAARRWGRSDAALTLARIRDIAFDDFPFGSLRVTDGPSRDSTRFRFSKLLTSHTIHTAMLVFECQVCRSQLQADE